MDITIIMRGKTFLGNDGNVEMDEVTIQSSKQEKETRRHASITEPITHPAQ